MRAGFHSIRFSGHLKIVITIFYFETLHLNKPDFLPNFTVLFSGNFELNEVEVGQRVSDLRQLLDVSYPMENGIIRNWDDMELLWNHTFGEGMVIFLHILCIKQISYT